MIKRTIEISGRGNHLFLSEGSLCIRRGRQVVGRVPLEDIGLLMLDAQDTTYTHYVVAGVLAAGAQPVTMENESLRVRVAKDYPLVLSYQRKAGGASFGGARGDERWKVTVLTPDRREEAVACEVKVVPPAGRTEGAPHRRWRLHCTRGSKKVLRFDATIALHTDEVVTRLADIRPAAGYDLRRVDFGRSIRVTMPPGAPRPTVCGGVLDRNPGAYFLVDPSKTQPRSPRHTDMIMLCQAKAVAVGFNNLPLRPWRYGIGGGGGSGGAEFWCPPFVHTVWAGAGEHYTRGNVTKEFVCRIGILGDRGGDGEIDWRDGAGFIRDHLPGGVELFQDWMRYEASDDFDNFIDVARRIWHFTDGRKQLCLHAAWQYWGWDSEYPAYMEPADELGGRAALYRLMRQAPKHRCLVTLIHNWDDAYKHSPAWDESLIMRRGDQSLLEATAWAGGRSYRTGHFKMWKLGWVDKVLDGLVAQGARRRIFSDVLSTSGGRVDHDRNMPADELASLVLGKFKVIEAAGKRGIAVSSESVTWPYVGRICSAHSMPLGISEDPHEVPLGPFVLHGKMAYQAWRGGPRTLLAGCDNTTGWDNDKIYLWHLVLAQYADKPMTDYTRKGGLFRTEFGKGTFVEWNRPKRDVRVEVGGRLIFNGRACFIPKETPNVYLAYAKAAGAFRFPRPKGWTDASKLLAFGLSDAPARKVDPAAIVKFEGREIVLRLGKGRPVRLCYGRDAYEADRKLRQTPLPPPRITWPEDEVLQTRPPGGRPAWIRKSTRRRWAQEHKLPAGAALLVGAGAKFATEAASRHHAMSIVRSKLQWRVRQGYVGRSRQYERELRTNTSRLGFDNWNLGLDAVETLYSDAAIEKRKDAIWYVEKLRDNNPQLAKPRIAYKVFVGLPIAQKDLHDLYVAAIRLHLRAAADGPARPGDTKRRNRIRLWTHMLEQESKKDR